ncbi:MAG: GNAT family N-acetyltransferase [Dehalococcoidia bacterium]
MQQEIGRVIPLAPEMAPSVAATFSRAYYHDPLVRVLAPDERKRDRRLRWWYERMARFSAKEGKVEAVVQDSVEGAALWLGPGKEKITLRTLARAGMLRAPLVFGVRPLARTLKVMGPTEKLHFETVPDPHWYLLAIGVDPAHQGRGIAAALIKHGLARVDADGLSCYLDTHEDLLGFYQKFGFTVAGELPAHEGTRLFGMVRHARL